MVDVLYSVCGLFGAAVIVWVYWMLQTDRISSKNSHFYLLNAIGALLICVSIGVHFDWGDLGGIAVELCWFIVSLVGYIKCKMRDATLAVAVVENAD